MKLKERSVNEARSVCEDADVQQVAAVGAFGLFPSHTLSLRVTFQHVCVCVGLSMILLLNPNSAAGSTDGEKRAVCECPLNANELLLPAQWAELHELALSLSGEVYQKLSVTVFISSRTIMPTESECCIETEQDTDSLQFLH
ncbi:hypothetical protein F2P79_022502 [Pimephales promelas]|nr:hypothetical protein F2P79_022502 [Pimephales promelas]